MSIDEQHHGRMSSKASFLVGLGAGVLVICTVGFFILLTVVLKGGIKISGSTPTPVIPDSSGDGQPSAVAPSVPDETVGEVAPVDANKDHIRGNKNAKVTLVEYSDFQCPYCQKFHPTMQQALTEYGDKVRWVYRHYPLSFHPSAVPAANAAECASEQGKFWEYADKLFENQALLSDTYYGQLATELKLNKAKFDSCYSTKKFQAEVNADQASGNTAGVSGTPATIVIGVNGSKKLISGAYPYDTVKAAIDAALQN
jgi:protein-disulfide isomerase